MEVGYQWRWGTSGGGVLVEVGYQWRWGTRRGGKNDICSEST